MEVFFFGFIWYLCRVWCLAGPCLGHRVTSSAARRRGQDLRCCASAPSSQCMGCCGPRRGATSTSNTLSLHSHPHAHPHFYQHSHSHLRRQQSERSDPCRWRQPRRSVAQVSQPRRVCHTLGLPFVHNKGKLYSWAPCRGCCPQFRYAHARPQGWAIIPSHTN